MNLDKQYSTWAEIDLDAIRSNLQLTRQKAGVEVMAVVKANAYGHGLVPTAQTAVEAGASWLGVARIEEALDLRSTGLQTPVLLLGYTPPARLAEAIQAQLSMTVWSVEQIKEASQHGQRLGQPARLHLKTDTGMSRLGVPFESAAELAVLLSRTPDIVFEGLFTHFARADEQDPSPTDLQEERFAVVLQQLDRLGLRPPLVHASNSAATLTRRSAHFNLVRLGIALYGLHPSADCLTPPGYRPALSWKSVLSQVKSLPPGRGVSYGHAYTTRAQEIIGTIPVGYADGLRRVPGNRVLVGGVSVPVVGRVCMDQIMVRLDRVPEARPGDEVILIGRMGKEKISAEDLAETWGTINYEVVCGISARVPRLYKPS